MGPLQPKFEKNLTTPDLPPEVGEYISDLRKQLDIYQPRMEALVNKGPANLTNEEIDELTDLNNQASKILNLIKESRDRKKIVLEKIEKSEEEKQAEEEAKEEAEEKAYNEAYKKLRSKLSLEAKVERYNITIGSKTKEEIIQELENRKGIFPIWWPKDWAKDLINREEFTISKETKNFNLVRLTVADLGFPNDGASIEEIYKRANELNLDLCPAEVGPQLLLQSDIEEWTLIGMNQIISLDDSPYVFELNYEEERLPIRANYAKTGDNWNPAYSWVFALRKPENKKL